jgi:hypothetical protein
MLRGRPAELSKSTAIVDEVGAAAPIAAAAPVSPSSQQTCATIGAGTVCQSPGNVQINDAPPPVSFYPYGGEAFLL